MSTPTLNVKSIVLIAICTLFAVSTYGQLSVENSIAFNSNKDELFERLMVFEDGDLLMLVVDPKTHIFNIKKYNTELEVIDSVLVERPKGYSFEGHYNSGNDTHLLFLNENTGFYYVRINTDDLTITTQEGEFPGKYFNEEFVSTTNFAYFKLYNDRSIAIGKLNIKTGEWTESIVSIAPFANKNLVIDRLETINETDDCFTYVIAYEKDNAEYFAIQFDKTGKQHQPLLLSEKTDFLLSSASAYPVGSGEFVFIGTYSSIGTALSEGVYFATASEPKVDFINFYSFSDFKEFFNYLSTSEKQALQNKSDDFEKNFTIAEHRVRKIGDNYLFVGEAYYNTDNIALTSENTTFGNRYTHATIVSFDASGNKQWDKCLVTMPLVKPNFVNRFVQVTTNNNQIDLLFAKENKVYIKSISFDGELLAKDASDPILTSDEEGFDKNINPSMVYWYSKYCLVYNSFFIRESANDSKSKNDKNSAELEDYIYTRIFKVEYK